MYQKRRIIDKKRKEKTHQWQVSGGKDPMAPVVGRLLISKTMSSNHPPREKLRDGKERRLSMSIMYAFTDSFWQEVTEFVNAFVVLYRAEVI